MKSITDKPIERLSEDLLKVERYSLALTNFIKSSDTPITIGLQGEWGTGKTSLMCLMREILDREDIATSWVNTWEYSMFVGSSETTPRVLQGMLEKLEENCIKNGTWDIGDRGSQAIKTVGKFLGSVANQMVKKQTGVNVIEAYEGNVTDQLQSQVAIIKEQIKKVINDLIDSSGNPYKKVVFFVDDLDRINPTDAVEVLEALKNIFDLPNCVYVLAIDYDVVVKGLEDKFGPKNSHNEREFRSFFDKIIQVPFSMPTGTYNISNFLQHKLDEMGIHLSPLALQNFSKVVDKTVGANPRSLKRYLNSFSLINNVKLLDDEDGDASEFILFALLGIQISYPNIFRLISREPNFIAWDKSFANKLSLNWAEIEEKIATFGENELTDETWEKIVWAMCQKDPFLQSKVFQILSLLGLMREIAGENLKDDIEAGLKFASITNVDDDPDVKQSSQQHARVALEGGFEEWCSNRKYDEQKRKHLANFIELIETKAPNLETKFTKTQITFRNTKKTSGGAVVLYLKSVSNTHLKGGTAGQNNQQGYFESLCAKFPECFDASVTTRVQNSNTTTFGITFSLTLNEINDEKISALVELLDHYQRSFH